MLLTSTRTTLHSLRSLVEAWERNERLNSTELTELHQLNSRALSQNLTRLVRAGLLHSTVGGNSRGYTFSRNPRDISLADVLDVLEGRTAHKGCKQILPQLIETIECERCLVCMVMDDVLQYAHNRFKAISLYDFARHCSTNEYEL